MEQREVVPDAVLGRRDVVVVSGADAAAYLQGQVSQDLRPLAVGGSAWTFVLQPTGKVDVLARVARLAEDRFELDTDVGYGDALAARLTRFRIRVDVHIESLPDERGVARDDVARVAIGWPAMGAEILAGETIPAATGLTGLAVSFTKGCYPGQELVERMDSRAAQAPRSLRRMRVGADARPGDPVIADGVEVGALTSVAGGMALAFVQRTADIGEPVEF